MQGSKLLVSDLESTNGILFMGERLASKAFDGEAEFEVGALRFEVKCEEIAGLSRHLEHTVVVVNTPKTQSSNAQAEIAVAPSAQQVSRTAPVVAEPKRLSDLGKASPPRESVTKNSPTAQRASPAGQEFVQEQTISRIAEGDFVDEAGVTHYKSVGFELEYDPAVTKLRSHDFSLQGMITWGGDVFDVRQFLRGDAIVLGNNPLEPIYLPSVVGRMHFGRFFKKLAEIRIPKKFKWSFSRQGEHYDIRECVSANWVQERSADFALTLALGDSVSIELGYEIALHLFYVEIPRPLVKRTLIENREEFKKSIVTSMIVHGFIAVLAMTSAPKEKTVHIEGVKDRYAKLIVEPPPVVAVVPTPPPPTPTPTPTPQVAEQPTPQPKPIATPEPPKKIAKKPEPKPVEKVVKKTETVPKQKVVKSEPTPQVAKQSTEPEQKAPESKPDQSQLAAESLLAALGNVPSPAQANSKPVKIDASAKTMGTSSGQMAQNGSLELAQSLKGRMPAASLGNGGNAMAQAGSRGFSDKGIGGLAGKRKVEGSVVGSPSFAAATKGPQGLTQKEIMNEINKVVRDIQQCYEKALFKDANVSGRVEYEWTIDPKGHVLEASVKKSDVAGGDLLNNCVLNVIRKINFPSAKNGQETIATIGFPFGKN